MSSIVLYIDPGTGAMLFSVLMGIVSVAFFSAKGLWVKIKFLFTGGKSVKVSDNRIPLVIFSDHKRYWNVFKPICDELEKREFECEFWTASPDDPALDENYQHVKTVFIGEGNKPYATLNLIKADICLATTPGLDVYQWKRSPEVKYYVHIPHDTADPTLYRMFGIDFYDAALYSGTMHEKRIREIEKLRNIKPKEIVTVGSVYHDTMMKRKKELCNEPSVDETKADVTTVLLAPTWGVNSTLARYREKLLDALIDTGYNIVVRPHPQSFTAEKDFMDEIMRKYPENDKFHWNRDNDNFEVLSKSDILISDYSGVMFDFVNIFERPIIYANIDFDYAPYDAAWLNRPIWNIQILPEIGLELNDETIKDMKKLIDDTISNPGFAKGIEKAREETWKYRGEAAVRVADYIVNKYTELMAI